MIIRPLQALQSRQANMLSFQLTLVVSQVMFFQNSESRYLIAGCQIQAIRKLTIMRLKYITSIQNPKSINGTMKCGYP